MGGFGSGGQRSGAGRKRKAKHLRLIDGGADRRGGGGDEPPGAEPPPVVAGLEPPAWLTAIERQLWDSLAPLAQHEGTLTPSTCFAFVHLLQLQAEVLELDVLLGRPVGEQRTLPMLSHKQEQAYKRQRLMVRKELAARLKDFKLAPMGKELTPAGAEGRAPGDELDAFTR